MPMNSGLGRKNTGENNVWFLNVREQFGIK